MNFLDFLVKNNVIFSITFAVFMLIVVVAYLYLEHYFKKPKYTKGVINEVLDLVISENLTVQFLTVNVETTYGDALYFLGPYQNIEANVNDLVAFLPTREEMIKSGPVSVRAGGFNTTFNQYEAFWSQPIDTIIGPNEEKLKELGLKYKN